MTRLFADPLGDVPEAKPGQLGRCAQESIDVVVTPADVQAFLPGRLRHEIEATMGEVPANHRDGQAQTTGQVVDA